MFCWKIIIMLHHKKLISFNFKLFEQNKRNEFLEIWRNSKQENGIIEFELKMA